MAEFPTLNGLWLWPWPWIGSYCIPSCITHRPLPTCQISLKSKKLCGRTDVRTYRRTTHGWTFDTGFIRSTLSVNGELLSGRSRDFGLFMFTAVAMATRSTPGDDWSVRSTAGRPVNACPLFGGWPRRYSEFFADVVTTSWSPISHAPTVGLSAIRLRFALPPLTAVCPG